MLRSLLKVLRGRADSGRPDVNVLLDQAATLLTAGDMDGARATCESALAAEPHNARALHLLGGMCGQAGDYAGARELLARAVVQQPDSAAAHVDMGNVQQLLHDQEGAERSYRRALELDPGLVAAHLNLARLLRSARRVQEALPHFRLAYATGPELPGLLAEFVAVLLECDAGEEALTVARSAVVLDGSNANARRALGAVLQQADEPAAALEQYQLAVAALPDDPDLRLAIGLAQQALLRLDAALESYERALALAPGHVLARWHRALLLLLRGDYARGWQDYEIRHLSEGRPRRPFKVASWEGQSLRGRTVLVYAEQGLGDEIMFASCLPEIVAAAGNCIIDCHPGLQSLYRRSFPGALVHGGTQFDDASWLDAFRHPDYQVAVGSLPRLLRGGPERFPRHQGYLRAEPRDVCAWKQRLAALGPGLKVGISWQGGTRISRRQLRSLALADLLPVLNVAGVQFVNLQYSPVVTELEQLRAAHGVEVRHWQQAIDDYDQTAALVSALDLVITVCTAVVHLSGALGRPVWVLAPYSPEWRYGFAGDSMPWYPSARIFRQSAYREWKPVISTVAQELAHLAGGYS